VRRPKPKPRPRRNNRAAARAASRRRAAQAATRRRAAAAAKRRAAQAEAAARRKAALAARLKAEREARIRAEKERQRRAAEAARRKAAEAEAQHLAALAAKYKAEQEARRKAALEAQRKEQMARQAALLKARREAAAREARLAAEKAAALQRGRERLLAEQKAAAVAKQAEKERMEKLRQQQQAVALSSATILDKKPANTQGGNNVQAKLMPAANVSGQKPPDTNPAYDVSLNGIPALEYYPMSRIQNLVSSQPQRESQKAKDNLPTGTHYDLGSYEPERPPYISPNHWGRMPLDDRVHINKTVRLHTVKTGQGLFAIAAEHGVTAEAIQALNPQIMNINDIFADDKLVIPPPGWTPSYGVWPTEPKRQVSQNASGESAGNQDEQVASENREYESFEEIAAELHIPVAQLIAANADRYQLYSHLPIADRKNFFKGLKLHIPPRAAYVVEAGDYLGTIAKAFGVSVNDLALYNGITDPEMIIIGQVLHIPPKGWMRWMDIVKNTGDSSSVGSIPPAQFVSNDGVRPWSPPQAKVEVQADGTIVYTIQEGDSLFAVAAKFGVEIADLRRLNGIEPFASDIQAGTLLVIPSGGNVSNALALGVAPSNSVNVTGGYGDEYKKNDGSSYYHTGVDYIADNVYSNVNGKVYFCQQTAVTDENGNIIDWSTTLYNPIEATGNLEGYGYFVVLESEVNGEKIYQILAHLGGFAKGLEQGQEVEAGTFLGVQGDTGNTSGPHVHWEVRKDKGVIINTDTGTTLVSAK